MGRMINCVFDQIFQQDKKLSRIGHHL
jgi:hypothetical protein